MHLCGKVYKHFSLNCCKCNSFGCIATIKRGNASHGPHNDIVYSGSEHRYFNSPRLVNREAGFPNPRWLAQTKYDALMTHHTTENNVLAPRVLLLYIFCQPCVIFLFVHIEQKQYKPIWNDKQMSTLKTTDGRNGRWAGLNPMYSNFIRFNQGNHYGDVMISTMTSRNTSVSIVYSTVCSYPDKRKHQRSAVTGEFHAHRASNAENVSIWWHRHEI